MFLDMHGLIFHLSISPLAGSTRHLADREASTTKRVPGAMMCADVKLLVECELNMNVSTFFEPRGTKTHPKVGRVSTDRSIEAATSECELTTSVKCEVRK